MKDKSLIWFRGRVGKAAMVSKTGNAARARAVANYYAGRDKDGKAVYKSAWFSLVFAGALMERAKTLYVGDLIEVTGEVRPVEYESNGETRHDVEIFVRELDVINKKDDEDNPLS